MANVNVPKKNPKGSKDRRLLKKLYIDGKNNIVICADCEEREIQKKGRAYQKEGFSSFNEYFRFLMNHKKEMENVRQKNDKNKR